ncbi:hypothetical protein NP493_1252g00041 [Ridgeia piscesae]|uniref:Uncharacterized protein n=1 Tax=Ridgeia piscesae TaxID=27915 RepID=A0AAD9KCI2_RIDPI|nr:hypothetical protein NP493_1252g00041 [Ridgeia piscesae]
MFTRRLLRKEITWTLSTEEERIPGVYNVKKRLGLIDYDAIIAEAKLRLPRKLREISATLTETEVPALPPIVSPETGRARAAPDTRLEASRLRLPHVAQEKKWFTKLLIACLFTGNSEDIEEGQEAEQPKRRTTQAGGRGGCEKKRPSRNIPPTFVRLQVLEKGQHFGRVDPTPPLHPPVTVVSNGAQCILLSKSFLSRHREDAMWKMCGKPDLPRPREDALRHSVHDERRWQAARSRIFDRLARRSRCRAALVRQFPPSYAGQYSFRTGPTPR